MYAVYLNAPMNSASKEGKIEKDKFSFFFILVATHGDMVIF